MDMQKFDEAKFSKKQQNNINQTLIEASIKHKYQQIKMLINQGADVNYLQKGNQRQRQDDYTPLFCAIHSKVLTNQENYLKVIELLLSKGADPNYQVRRGYYRYQRKQPNYLLWFKQIFQQFKSNTTKIILIELLAKHGADFNKIFKHHVGFHYSSSYLEMSLVFGIFDGWESYQPFKLLNNISYEKKSWQISQQYGTYVYNKFLQINNLKETQQMPNQEQLQNKLIHVKKQYFQRQKKQKKASPEVFSVLQTLIKLGVNPNSYREYTCQSFCDYRINKQRYQYQTLLHRAIFRNQPKQVRLLLENGADPNINCKYLGTGFCFPHQWPTYHQNSKTQESLRSLQRWEREKIQLEQLLIKEQDQEKKQLLLKNMFSCKLNLFKFKTFMIQNATPEFIGIVQQISCLQLAKLYEVDQQIIQLLRKYQKKG